MSVTLSDILAARERIKNRVYHSPCVRSNDLSQLLEADAYVKLDNLQQTGSFKERGACNRLLQLTDGERASGVICASAGNHAQAVAYHARQMGINVTVVMPKWAPLVKVSNCRAFGATVIMHGEAFDDARAHAIELSQRDGTMFIPPFDDPHIIAGAGTCALEILEDVPQTDAIFVPVGGGGLLAGMSVVLRAKQSKAELVAVESTSAPTLYESLKAGHPVRTPTKPSLADGLNVAQIGKLPFELLTPSIKDVILVDEAPIASAILRLLEGEKTLVEGAGAIALAGAIQSKERIRGKTVVLVLCGGNIDVTVLSRIIDRGLRVDGRLCRFIVQISDRPGSLAQMLKLIASAGASIKEVSHDRHFGPADVARVAVNVVIETQGFDHIERVRQTLKQGGHDPVLDE